MLFSYNPAGPDVAAALMDHFDRVKRLGCSQAVLSQVATGAIEVAVTMNPSPPPWDVPGGAFMIERGGGTVTDTSGEEWTIGSEGMIASVSDHHAEALAVIQRPLDSE